MNIAEIPTDEFEAAIESKRPPGTTLLAQWNKLDQRERVRGITERSLAEVFKSAHAARAAEGMLEFEKNADACGVEVIVEILRGHTKKL